MPNDVTEFLDVRVGDVKIPTVLPSGLFRFILTRNGLERENNDKRTPFVKATFKAIAVVECDEDVDIDSVRTVTRKFYRTENADKITIDFFQRHLGMELEADDTLGSLWEAAIGAEVLGEVKQSIAERSGNPYAEIVRFLKVD